MSDWTGVTATLVAGVLYSFVPSPDLSSGREEEVELEGECFFKGIATSIVASLLLLWELIALVLCTPPSSSVTVVSIFLALVIEEERASLKEVRRDGAVVSGFPWSD
jgi:hypothetical protein